MSADRALAALSACGELRTWSLIVTIFGDMARSPGKELPGPFLSTLTGRIGIRPEAMRVALHRLRKDGWITSRREGRVSHYRLSVGAQRETARASRLVYAEHPPPRTDGWHILVQPPGFVRPGQGDALEVAPGVWLGTGPASGKPGALAVSGALGPVPAWLREAIVPPELTADCQRFHTALKRAEQLLPAAALPPVDRAALRVLVLHGWRRLVLRTPAIAPMLFPQDCEGAQVRQRVFALLHRFETPTTQDLVPEPARN